MTLRWTEEDLKRIQGRRIEWINSPANRRYREFATASAMKMLESIDKAPKLDKRTANLIPGGHTKAAKAAKPKGMNKWEAQFAQSLEYRKKAGEIVWWAFEPLRIRLADETFYRPDFVTVDRFGRTEIFEVKGRMREAARVRLRVAVEKLPYKFFLVRKHKGELRVTPV